MFQRTRISIQIVMTLISFFGFNEAVLALRYRNSIYLSNMGCPMVCQDDESDPLHTIDYTLSEAISEPLEALGFDISFGEFLEHCIDEVNDHIDGMLTFSLEN